jgi:hypothetical protein
MYHSIYALPLMDLSDDAPTSRLLYVAAWSGNMGSGCEVCTSRPEANALAWEWANDEGSDDTLFFFAARCPDLIKAKCEELIHEQLDDYIEEHRPDERKGDPRYATNVEVVTKLMEFSRYGALAQAFVVEAISRYADQCSAMTDEEVAKHDAEQNMLSYKAWRGVAREIKAIMDERYHPGKKT